jgi:hypothetical protein
LEDNKQISSSLYRIFQSSTKIYQWYAVHFASQTQLTFFILGNVTTLLNGKFIRSVAVKEKEGILLVAEGCIINQVTSNGILSLPLPI